MKLETNFQPIDIIISNTNEGDVKSKRYLRDFKFLLMETEKKIYYREFIEASYTLRMAWDLSRQFIGYMLSQSTSRIMVDWNENLKDREKGFRKLAEKKGWHYERKPVGYKVLFEEYPTWSQSHVEGVGTMEDVVKKFTNMNRWLHYSYDTNYTNDNNAKNSINDKSTLYIHRGDVRYSAPTINESIDYLETVYGTVLMIINLSEMYGKEIEFNFDRSIYNDLKPSTIKLVEQKRISDLIQPDSVCPICKKGRFDYPDYVRLREDGERFPFGAFIVCNNDKCNAKADKTLKVKRDLNDSEEESICGQCGEDSLQTRVSLLKPGYIYTACKSCKYNAKSSNDDHIGELIDDAEQDYMDLLFDD